MKKALTVAISAVLLLTAQLPVYGEGTAEAEETAANHLDEYYRLDWAGDDLYYDQSSKAMFFKHADGKSTQTASYTITFEEAPAGFWFYTDMGNGSTDGDNGTVEISVIDKNGDSLFSVSSESIVNENSFRRHYLGKEDAYYPIDKNAAAITVTLTANDVDGGQLVDVYFRNLSLVFGNEEQTDYAQQDLLHLYSGDSLGRVEIGNYDFARWLWIGIIFVVAIIFYIIRMKKKKYASPKVIQPKKIYEK